MTPFSLQPAGFQSDGTYTWANRPSAVLYAGRIIAISDIGSTGSLWFSDGVAWVPLNRSVVLAASAVAVVTPADITEDVLATITVPANAMGANGVLRITTTWSYTNNANTKTVRIRYSGLTGALYVNSTLTTQLTIFAKAIIANRGVTNSQIGYADGVNASGGLIANAATSAADTTASTTIVITGQKAVGTDTLTLESYLVELIIP
jgi:hypothetical protein